MNEVLLVEDDAEVRELVESALEAKGLQVRSAASDVKAYDILKQDAKSFSVLIADINLGSGTTGYDVARRARQLNSKIAVVYISGPTALVDRFGVENSVMYPKPFRPAELAEQIEALVSG